MGLPFLLSDLILRTYKPVFPNTSSTDVVGLLNTGRAAYGEHGMLAERWGECRHL